MTPNKRVTESGFTLLELLMSMAIMLVVLGGVSQVMTSAMRSETTAKRMLDMNSQLRAAMDLMQRDMLQVGQGLPVGRRISIPNGAGAVAILRPGPAASTGCTGVTTFPADSSIPAVTVGAGLGPAINGACTDVITTLSADNLFGPVSLASIAANGQTATVHNSVNISDNPDVGSDNLRPGDLLMLSKGTSTALMQVTAIAGQVVTFGTGAADPLGLNQFDTNLDMLGTINQLKAQAPLDPDAPVVVAGVQQLGPTEATRIRMVTYFADVVTEPLVPRLVRGVGGAAPNAVGIGLQAFRLTYDIADQINNPAAVRMDDDDLDGSGGCDPEPCSENQIRKVNIMLSMNTDDTRGVANRNYGRQSQNVLYAQVSLRSMAFVDRYR